MYIKSAKILLICKKNRFLRFFEAPAQGEKIEIFNFLKKIRKLWQKSTPDSYMDNQVLWSWFQLNTSNIYIYTFLQCICISRRLLDCIVCAMCVHIKLSLIHITKYIHKQVLLVWFSYNFRKSIIFFIFFRFSILEIIFVNIFKFWVFWFSQVFLSCPSDFVERAYLLWLW